MRMIMKRTANPVVNLSSDIFIFQVIDFSKPISLAKFSFMKVMIVDI